VLGLADRIEDLILQPLPVLTRAVLLPFKGKIVDDGLLSSFAITFGPGIRRRLNDAHR
jgi:hypothetical protein